MTTIEELELRIAKLINIVDLREKEIVKLKDEKLRLSKRLHPRHGDILMISAEVWQEFMGRHRIHTDDALFMMQTDMLRMETPDENPDP